MGRGWGSNACNAYSHCYWEMERGKCGIVCQDLPPYNIEPWQHLVTDHALFMYYCYIQVRSVQVFLALVLCQACKPIRCTSSLNLMVMKKSMKCLNISYQSFPEDMQTHWRGRNTTKEGTFSDKTWGTVR